MVIRPSVWPDHISASTTLINFTVGHSLHNIRSTNSNIDCTGVEKDHLRVALLNMNDPLCFIFLYKIITQHKRSSWSYSQILGLKSFFDQFYVWSFLVGVKLEIFNNFLDMRMKMAEPFFFNMFKLSFLNVFPVFIFNEF